MFPKYILVDHISHKGGKGGAEVYGLPRRGKARQSVEKRLDMSHYHVLLISHLGLGEEGIQRQTAVLVQGMVGRPDGGAFCREGVDRPIVLVPHAFLAVVESVEESGIIHMKLVGANADYRACSRSV